MNHDRKHFNAKSRQSTAGRSRKKGKFKKTGDTNSSEQADSNNVIHIPKTREEKIQKKKEKLKAELLLQSESKMNSKKKKRLEKYIEKKLKKEDRVEIIQKLSKTQGELPSTLILQSSSLLGTGKVASRQEQREVQEDRTVRRAIEGLSKKRKRRIYVGHEITDSESDDGSLPAQDGDNPLSSSNFQSSPVIDDIKEMVAAPAQSSQSVTSTAGSALRRGPDGATVTPTATPTKRKMTSFRSWKHANKDSHPTGKPGEDSYSSFDSSDSSEDERSPEGDIVDGVRDKNLVDNSPLEGAPAVKRRRIGFKDWALKQLSDVKGYVAPPGHSADSAFLNSNPVRSASITRTRAPLRSSKAPYMRGPLGEELQLPTTVLASHFQSKGTGLPLSGKKVIPVTRSPDIEEQRLLLPIVSEEQPIMEAALLHPVVIICGETGSGKTTQLPQFLYEAGFGTPEGENPGMIGVTQPRRVAAMSMAARVGRELSLGPSRVSYQIRYDATVSPTTVIKFMTDGVLLRELSTDFLLTKYSVIVVDEAHERSMNTDILIGVLSRVVRLREEMWKEGKEGCRPLRLIIMSATLRVSDFAENSTLFPSPPPLINVTARQHPVTVHFARRTVSDYITEAVRKASKIHTKLPPGGILIFLTGQNEISGVCKKLEAKFGSRALDGQNRRRIKDPSVNKAMSEDTAEFKTASFAQVNIEAEDIELGDTEQGELALDVDDSLGDEGLDSDEDIIDDDLGVQGDCEVPMHIVPLYSMLSSEKQMKVFQPPPPGARLVVVSTNIAETSLTIPEIRYVIDSGRAKERRYDIANGVQAFQVCWISKASAAQRAGRAGRTGPGHCYRLYSSALFEHQFDEFSRPELLRVPIEGVVLQMKSMHIDAVVNFPFPTPPDRETLRKAEIVLTHLGALHGFSQTGTSVSASEGQITEVGKAMSLFPLSPRFSRMLVGGQQKGCLPYVISMVSAMSVGDPFLREGDLYQHEMSDGDGDSSQINNAEEHLHGRRAFFESQHRHASLGGFTSDVFKMLSVVGAYEYAGGGHQFCAEHFVRPKAMEEIHKLRAQISNIVEANFPGTDTGFSSDLPPPSDVQLKVLRQLLAAGFIDQVAVLKERTQGKKSTGTQYSSTKGVPYRAMGVNEDVYIHPSSVLANAPPPEYLVFNEVLRTSQFWLKGLTVVNPHWLSSLGRASLCTFSKPVKNSVGAMMVVPHFGPEAWELPPIKAFTKK